MMQANKADTHAQLRQTTTIQKHRHALSDAPKSFQLAEIKLCQRKSSSPQWYSFWDVLPFMGEKMFIRKGNANHKTILRSRPAHTPTLPIRIAHHHQEIITYLTVVVLNGRTSTSGQRGSFTHNTLKLGCALKYNNVALPQQLNEHSASLAWTQPVTNTNSKPTQPPFYTTHSCFSRICGIKCLQRELF